MSARADTKRRAAAGAPVAPGVQASAGAGADALARGYLRRNVGEYLLVLASAWAVATTSLNAFFLDELLAAVGWWGRAGISLAVLAVLVGVLYAAAARRGRRVVGVVVYVAALAVLVAASLALSGGEDLYEDAEGNYLYMALVLAACATACFLLTRTLAGSMVWFVAAAFVCSVVQAFYESEELPLAVLAALTALALVVHKNFRLGMEQAHVANPPSSAGAFGLSVGSVAAVVACALAVWFGVVAPLEPGVLDVKLLTDYRSLPIDELKGTADENPQLNLDYTSDQLVDGTSFTTDDLVRDPASSVVVDATSLLLQQMAQELEGLDEEGGSSGGGADDALDEDSLDSRYNALSYTELLSKAWVVALLAALLAAAVVGYFVGRRAWRRRTLRRMLLLAPAEQVQAIYRFLLVRLERLGFSQPAGMTLTQWAHSASRSMEVLDAAAHVPFARLTATYEACVYGDYEPTEDDVVPFAVYYLNFWRAARAYLGNLKYFFKSFRL